MPNTTHDWLLVAPWWRWPNPADTQGGRLTRPVLQKYDSPKLVEQFLAHPQRSLRFTTEDLVHVARATAAAPLGSNGKPRRLTELEYVPDGTNTRKVFLDTHRRFYLVVVELHCDTPGFPNASRGDVCEAGFVVRRRTTDVTSVSAAGAREGGTLLRSIGAARQELALVESDSAIAQARRASTRARLTQERERLVAWAARFGVAPQLQGWFPSATADKVGAWKPISGTPSEIAGEATFPLYPLIPPPTDKKHDGQFGTVYFGLLPTGTGETDDRGRARFDDRQFYEIACYARRHLKPHPRAVRCPCPDGLFWSAPSDPYKLAAHFDLVGTSKRPVTVQMPDLDALAAQATPTLGVAFAKPKGALMIAGKKDGSLGAHGRSSAPEICSFSIPLITIVASFVFELFLPVVTLLFGLWFLLKLKFCIPPEIELAAGVTAEIDVTNASLAFEAGLKASVDASIDAGFGATPEIADALKNEYSPIAGANLGVQLAAASAAATGPSVSAGVSYEPEVARP